MAETASVPHTEKPVVLRISKFAYLPVTFAFLVFALIMLDFLSGPLSWSFTTFWNGSILTLGLGIGFWKLSTLYCSKLVLTTDSLTLKTVFSARTIRHKDITAISGRADLVEAGDILGPLQSNLEKTHITLYGPPGSKPLILHGGFFRYPEFRDWISDIPDGGPALEQQLQTEKKIRQQQADAKAIGEMAEETPVFGDRKDQRKQNFLKINLILLFWVTLGVPVDVLLCIFTENPAVLFWVPMAFAGGALLYILLQPQKILFFRPVAPSFSASVWFRTGAILGVHSLLISMAALIATPNTGIARFPYLGIAVAAVFFFALRHAVPDLKSAGKRIKVAAFCALILFSYSGLRMANVLFDGQSIRHVTMELKSVDPHTGHVKIRTHLKNLMPANQIAQIKDLAFPNPEPGQSVCVRFGPGALGTPWLLPDKGCDKIK